MQLLGWLLIVTGILFFVAGMVALLRFPDLFSRMHALTKADNLGLGFICAGLAVHSHSVLVAFKLLLIWLLVLLSSASVAYIISRTAFTLEHKQEADS